MVLLVLMLFKANAYHKNEDKQVKSGVMVHYVIDKVDKGEVISTMSVPMIDGESFDKVGV